MKKSCFCLLVITLYMMSFSSNLSAQTTAFTYQGSLNVSGAQANGSFDFTFELFDVLSGGSQIGSLIAREAVQVVNGNFTVTLDFGGVFPGADRFLQVAVRTAGDPAGHSLLSPRSRVNSSPYAVRSLGALNAVNATQLGGVAANQYVLTGDVRLSDARPPLPGSADYIQNGTSTQASSNFNISGNGTVGGTLSSNVVRAVTQYNIGADRILSNAGTDNLFTGVDSGSSNTSGAGNSFFGHSSGNLNTTGNNNSFFGRDAGRTNTTGGSNSFFGLRSGDANTTGSNNSFFGVSSGGANTIGVDNSFFGSRSGATNTTGSQNSTFGFFSGVQNTSGSGNSIFGYSAGGQITTGSNNTIIGSNADVAIDGNNLSFATAIGAGAIVAASNTVVLGRSNDQVGIGTTAPTQKLHIATNSGNMLVGGAGCPSGNIAIGLNGAFGNCTEYTVRGDGSSVYINRPTGGFVFFREGNGGSQVLINPGGALELRVLGAAGGTALCRNATQEVAFCSSSLRYKKNISSFAAGMSLVRQLQPIAYEWKADGMKDVGFGAEDVALIDPRFVTYNDKGEVEGIKYDRLSTAFVNAFTEQQTQIESQKAEIDALKSQLLQQKSEVSELKALICSIAGNAGVCSGPK
ncbi:MAG: tail fiber domain-containing protein [Pyrinomonadaceae bacterium]|nr:tail fiber domain-containing protein [Pyrinomonadaceae bacterium]MBP6212534.1 tail fiber domain-containing protein [Pyrinomonadaceae bacterium]